MPVRAIERRRRRDPGRAAAAALVIMALVAAACGGDDDSGTPATTAAPEDTAPPGDDSDDERDPGDGDAITTAPPAPVVTAPPASEFEPQYGGRIIVGIEAETGSPWLPSTMLCDTGCHIRARTFFDPLVVIDDNLQWQPYLAETIEPNDDFSVWTITIREGITFHDGSALNADVVIDNMNRTFTGLLVSGAVRDLAKNPDGSLLTTKIDDYTLTVQTGFRGDPAQPIRWELLPYSMAGQAGLIASSEWLAAVDAGSADPTAAVGTGPFVLDSFLPDDRMTVVRNPNYWVNDENGDSLPYLDEVEFRVIQDSQVRAQALISGDLDMIHTSDSFVVDRLANDASFAYLNQDQLGETNYHIFNLTKPYLADRNVRCALTQAIDPIDYLDVVTGGTGIPSASPFTPGQEGYLPDLERIPYDPDAARDAIATWEAANGPLQINISTTPTNTNRTSSRLLADYWSAVGVDVNIDEITQSQLIGNAFTGAEAFDVFAWRNHGGINVDQQYFWWHGVSIQPGASLNFGRLDDPEINRLLEAQRVEPDPAVRRGYAEEINRRFHSECFVIPTSQTRWGIHFDPRVQNIGRAPLPDGAGLLRDGGGFSGQVWFQAVFVSD